MSKLIIRKRVTLEFLGDAYKEAYLEFKSIPVADYDDLIAKTNSAKGSESFTVILDILKSYYLGGKFPNDKNELEDLESKEELDSLDRDALIECFAKLTGQDFKGMMDKKIELKKKSMR
jgi:hypothetical protein